MQQSVGEKLSMLQRVAPKRSRNGQLYSNKKETGRVYSRIRMTVILRSEENSLRFHQAVFNKKAGKTSAEWGAWMRLHFREVYSKSILAYMERSEEMNWQVLSIVGWTGERLARNAKRITRNSKVATRRNKTKRQGAKSGKNNLRRRHRNRKR